MSLFGHVKELHIEWLSSSFTYLRQCLHSLGHHPRFWLMFYSHAGEKLFDHVVIGKKHQVASVKESLLWVGSGGHGIAWVGRGRAASNGKRARETQPQQGQ